MASNPSFDAKTSALDVAATYSAQASGKIVLITGVSPGGLGEGAARAFAHGGASTVVITGRNDARLSEVTKTLSSSFPKTTFRPLKLDLASLKDVTRAAQEILDDTSIPHLDIIVASAGGFFSGERTLTIDGLEANFGNNHISHFHFITTLLPKIRLAASKSSPNSTRIVTVSSAAALASPLRFTDWNFEGKPVPDDEKPDFTIFLPLGVVPTDEFQHNIAYSQSKTANILFTVHLNTLLSSAGIAAYALHPGSVRTTNANQLYDQLTPEQIKGFEVYGGFKNPDQGASTILVAALDPGLKVENGVFLNDCQVERVYAPAYALDKEKAERLWGLSEEIVKERVGKA